MKDTIGRAMSKMLVVQLTHHNGPLESPTPLGRIGQTQDIATAAVYLAFSDSAWITGETLYITSGLR